MLVVMGTEPYSALLHAAQKLASSRIVECLFPGLTPEEQARRVVLAWEQLPEPRPALTLEIVREKGGDPLMFALGPHPPGLWPTDVDRVHRLWRGCNKQHPRRAPPPPPAG